MTSNWSLMLSLSILGPQTQVNGLTPPRTDETMWPTVVLFQDAVLLTRLLHSICVQRRWCQRLGRCRRRWRQAPGAPPLDSLTLWKWHWDHLPGSDTPQEHLGPDLSLTKSFSCYFRLNVPLKVQRINGLLSLSGFPWLTCVNLLQGDVFFQLPTETDLCSVLPGGPVIGQDEVRVAAVQGRQLAKWVGHHLVGSSHLRRDDGMSQWSHNWLTAQSDDCQHHGFIWCNPKYSSKDKSDKLVVLPF